MNNSLKLILGNIKKEKLLSLSNVIVMTVTFIVLGVFINIVVYSQTALRALESQAQVTIFFKDDFTEKNILDLKSTLESDKRIEVVKYVSKEDAFRIFSDINKNEPVLLESISASILPASLEIRAKNISQLTVLSKELSAKDGVEEVKFFKDVVDKFRFWSNVVYAIGFVLIMVFIMVSFAVVIMTLRTTINSRGAEFEILKLVGASDYYVKKPLIMQGMMFGGLSALIASVVLLLISLLFFVGGLSSGWVSFGLLPNLHINYWLFEAVLYLILIASGVGLGYLGSITAVKRYLKY